MKTNKSGKWAHERRGRDELVGEPGTWNLRFGPYVVFVTRLSNLDGWFMYCDSLAIRELSLHSTDIADAQNEAVRIVRERLQNMMRALDGVTA